MDGFYDVYVLSPHRSAKTAKSFLDTFLPIREPSAEEYHFPELSGQEPLTFVSASDAIHHCATHSGAVQAFYFRNLELNPTHAMLFFTADAGLILGLSVTEGQEAGTLDQLKKFAGATTGIIEFESPPPETVEEFERLVMVRDVLP